MRTNKGHLKGIISDFWKRIEYRFLTEQAYLRNDYFRLFFKLNLIFCEHTFINFIRSLLSLREPDLYIYNHLLILKKL